MPLDQTNWPHTTPLDGTTFPPDPGAKLHSARLVSRDSPRCRWQSTHRCAIRRGRRVVFRWGDGVEFLDPSFIPAIRRLELAMRTECIARFNDHQMTVDPVLAAFDRAIAAEDPMIARIWPDDIGKGQ